MNEHSPATDHDLMTRFLLPDAGVRGVHVRLHDAWSHIRSRDAYPDAVAELLGEAAVASALFTAHAKVEGRLSIQIRGSGQVRTVFTECTAAGTLRGLARIAEGAEPGSSRDLRELGADAILAITIENPSSAGREPMRYQGLVPIETDALASAFESYFLQSEQLPTRLLMTVQGEYAAGLMLQKLPGDSGDSDGWNRACALFDTLTTEELALPATELLHRLFHEEGTQLLGERRLAFACSCSRERVAAMLESLGADEARAAASDGEALIRCEFCGEQYVFSPAQIDGLFTRQGAQFEAPERVQ